MYGKCQKTGTLGLWQIFVSAIYIELYSYFLKREEVNQRVAASKVPKEGLRRGSRWDIGLGKVIGGDSQSLEYLGIAGYFTQT